MDATYTPVEAIFDDAKDKNVSMRVLYGNANKLYVDAAHKTEATPDEALDACMHGAFVYDETNGYSAITSFKPAGGSLTVKVGTTTYTVAA